MSTSDQIRRLQELSGIGSDGSIGFMKVYDFAKNLPHEDDPTKWLNMMSSLIKLGHSVADPDSPFQQQMRTASVPSEEVENILNAYDPSGRTFEELVSMGSD